MERCKPGDRRLNAAEFNQRAYEGRRALHPACSSRRYLVQLNDPFHPPLLGPTKDFCTQALLQGVPVPDSHFEKPGFYWLRDPSDLAGPAEEPTGPQGAALENWGKWCDRWAETQARVRRSDPDPPSIMNSLEGYRRKREDIELLSRTLPPRRLYGYNSYRPVRKSVLDEAPQPLYRKAGPVELHRVPRDLRDERSLPPREILSDEEEGRDEFRALPFAWQWEKMWAETIPVTVAKLFLAKDFRAQGGTDFEGTELFAYGRRARVTRTREAESQEDDEEELSSYGIEKPEIALDVGQQNVQSVRTGAEQPVKEAYQERRGPRLLINGPTTIIVLQQRDPLRPPPAEVVYDKMEQFAATTQSMESRTIRLVNKGTTVIRYQWVRSEPTPVLRALLANPGKQLQLQDQREAGVRSPVDLIQPLSETKCERSGGKRVALQLSGSRRVDPALTAAIKGLRNSFSASPAYENFLLLLALRVPRLRRALVRRTGRQLSRAFLPPRIRDLYLKLVQARRVRRAPEPTKGRKAEPKVLARRIRPSRSRTRSRSRRVKRRSSRPKSKEPRVVTQEPLGCPCQLHTCGEGEHWGEDGSPCGVCTCDLPAQPRGLFEGEDEGEWEEEEAEFDNPPPTPTANQEEDEEEQSSGGFEEVEEFGGFGAGPTFEEAGESSDPNRAMVPPPGTTDTFYPLKYGLSEEGLIREEEPIKEEEPIRKEKPIRDDEEAVFIRRPPGITSWKEAQRVSLTDPATGLIGRWRDWSVRISGSDSDVSTEGATPTDAEPAPDPNTFYELKGYEVRQKYDPNSRTTRIDIGSQLDVRSTGGEGDHSGREEEEVDDYADGIPLHSAQETHKLNTQSLTVLESPKPEPHDIDHDHPHPAHAVVHRQISSGASLELTPSFIRHFIHRDSPSMDQLRPCEDDEDDGECETDLHQILRHNENRHLLSDSMLLPPHPHAEYTDHHEPAPVPVVEPEVKPRKNKTLDEKASALKIRAKVNKLLKEKVAGVLRHVSKLNRVKVIKDPTYEFHFRELPGVLLPGQSEKFQITFRPRRPGFYTEKLYLVTHPQMGGQTYCLQLGGICMDPDFQPESLREPAKSPRTHTVRKTFGQNMMEKQGTRAMEAILDNIINLGAETRGSLPFGRVSAEDIFYAHNPTLYYHSRLSERGLELVRGIAGILIPDGVIEAHPSRCHLNIAELYDEALKPTNSSETFFWRNLLNPGLDELLAEFTKSTKVMSQAPISGFPSLNERKYLAVHSTVVGILDVGLRKVRRVDRGMKNPIRHLVMRRRLKERLREERVRLKLKPKTVERKRLGSRAVESGTNTKKDATTQKPDLLSARPSLAGLMPQVEPAPPPPAPRPTSHTKSKKPSLKETDPKPKIPKGGKTKEKTPKGSAKDGSTKEPEPAPEPAKPAPVLSPPPSPVDKALEFNTARLLRQSTFQANREIFQEVLRSGIARALVTIDALNSMPDFRESSAVLKLKPWYEFDGQDPEEARELKGHPHA